MQNQTTGLYPSDVAVCAFHNKPSVQHIKKHIHEKRHIPETSGKKRVIDKNFETVPIMALRSFTR